MLGFLGNTRRWALMGLSALLLVVVAAPSFAADPTAIPLDDKGLPMWQISERNDFPVLMELPDHAALEQLLAHVPIASFSREQVGLKYDDPKHFHLVFQPRVTEEEAAALEAAGYRFERIFDAHKAARQEAERAWAESYPRSADEVRKGIREFTYWPTFTEIETYLENMAASYPNLARHFTYGQSVQGRLLHGLVISDDVHNTEPEPEVRLASNIHGDEVPGMLILLNFIEVLLTNYGQPGYEHITDLVDNYEIHFMPMHNPDGFVADQRYNANGVDLNRNFPLPDGTHGTTEQENVYFMTHANNHHFVVSIMGHSGALVMNYPWDYTYTLAPDDEALQLLSLEWSTRNLPMYNGAFDQGITNGAQWYVITGSLQDWVYDQTDCFDVTAELHNTKWPSASQIPAIWSDNRESVFYYTKAARYGVNGVVTGSDTGLPLDATVTVNGIAKNTHTDPEHGDYWKLLHTGTFDITFEADGYIPQTITGVSTTWGTPTVLDVVLDPVAHGDVSGTVTDLSGSGLTASVNVYTHPVGDYVTTASATAGNGGAYTAHLVYGDYRLEAVAGGYVTQDAIVTIGENPVVQSFSLPVAAEVVVFSDDFESGISQWSGGWGIAIPAEGHDSENCLNDSPDSNYPDNANNTMETPSLDLSGSMSGEVNFWAKWHIENGWDGCFFEVSTDAGSSWTPLATAFTEGASGLGGQTPSGAPCFDNNQANWVLNTVNLSAYLDESDVRFRFRLSSDTSLSYSGFFVDDFEIMVVREENQSSPVPGADVLTADVKAWPNPFNPQTTVSFTLPRDGAVSVGIFDVQGRLVRTLVDDSLVAGTHNRIWDGSTDNGGRAASGVYFARMIAGENLATSKLMLVK